MNEYQWYKSSLPSVEEYAPRQSKAKKNSVLKPVLISAGVSAAFIAVFAAVVLPLLKNPTTIHYSNSPIAPQTSAELPALSAAARQCSDSTVYISSSGNLGGFFNRQIALGDGSGIIISDDGYIVTSSSAVNSGTEITVTLNDGQKVPATVVGNDVKTDIAVLKINADGLVPAILGSSDTINVGDPVIAVGNPLAPQVMNTVTYGIISGVNNNVSIRQGISMNLIQTDAYIDSGNAGGGLFTTDGEVIGIVISNIKTDGGISLAVPINDIKSILTSFIGTEDPGENPSDGGDTPMLGITASEEQYGVVVETVGENCPAERAGLMVGDIIMKIDNTPVATVAQINEIRSRHRLGDVMTATVFRNGETLEITVVLE